MKVTVSPIQRITDVARKTVAAHGLTLPAGFPLMAVYVNSGTGVITPADATAFATCKAFFITEIIDANTLEFQHDGFIEYAAHGLTVGEYYFVTDTGNGGFTLTPPVISDTGFYVVDSNTLLLIDNRPI